MVRSASHSKARNRLSGLESTIATMGLPRSLTCIEDRRSTTVRFDLAGTALKDPETNAAALCRQLKISRQTLYRHVSPEGELREDGVRALER